jgi:hypothetical protein
MYRCKEKQRYRKRKANGEIPAINQCTDRKKKLRKWRNSQKSILEPPASPQKVDENLSKSRKRE